MCTHLTRHASPCECILSRQTKPCKDANISIPPTFPAAGPGYQGTSCPIFKEEKEILPESDAECKRHSAAENSKICVIQAPERIRSSSEPLGGTKDKKHTSGEKLKMSGILTPTRKGSGSESVGGIGGVIEAGLEFEFGLVGLHGSGSPPTKVERMASVAKRVKPGKVKEMVMKFNAVVDQEEVARKVSEEPARKVSGQINGKVGKTDVLEDQGIKIEITGAHNQAEVVKIDEEELEDTLGDIISTYHHDDMSWKGEEPSKHGEDMEEIVELYDYYDTNQGIDCSEAGDRKEKAWKDEETEIELAQKFGQEDVAGEIKEIERQESKIEKLDETVVSIDMATKAWWVNETFGQDSITTKVQEAARQDETVTDITQSFYPEDNILKIDDTVAQLLTESGVDENFDGDDTSTYLDSALDENPLARDLIGLTVDVPSTRMSTLVRQYSELVSPVSELDDSQDLYPEPSILPPPRQYSDLISPATELDTDSASSRPVTPANPLDDYHLAELSPSTTPLLQRARTNESLPNSHHSIASAVSAVSGFSSNYSDYSPSSPSHDQDTTQSTSLTTNSTSDPFYIPPSSTNTPSFTTSSTPFTPQTFSGSFDSFVDAGAFAPFTPPVSFEDFITSLPGQFGMPHDLEHEGEGEGGIVVQEEDVADGLQSLLDVPADGTIWNWDGSRWVGQREDGSLVLGFELF